MDYKKYIDKLSLKDKEKIEMYANDKKFYLVYKLLIDRWIK